MLTFCEVVIIIDVVITTIKNTDVEQVGGCELEVGPWRRGWADVSRKLEAGASIEVSCERDMRSLIQVMRTCGFRSTAKKNTGGGYTVTKLGPRPRMIWVQAWKDGVQVRRQIPDPNGDTMSVSVAVLIPGDIYRQLKGYCKDAGVENKEAILQMVTAALLRHERYASAV